jgi:hypothetical protein
MGDHLTDRLGHLSKHQLMEALARRVTYRVSQALQAEAHRIDQGHSGTHQTVAQLELEHILLGLLAAMFNRVKQCGIHPGKAGQHHGITPVTLPFILVDCPCLSWIGHDHSKAQLLQKAAHPWTVRAGFHHRSGAGITSCHICELFARIAQTSLSGHLSGFVQHAIRVTTITKVQSDRDLRFIPSGCVIHKASSLSTRSMARWPSLPSHLILMSKRAQAM